MKKGYKHLLAFEAIIFIILIVNSFVSSILDNYKMVIFLLIMLLSFKFFFNFEKDRHRYTKDILFDCIIFLLIFFFLFYLSGIIFSFAKTNDYYNVDDMINIIIPIIITIIGKEFLRYQFLTKAEGSKLVLVITTIMFIFLDVSTAIYYNKSMSSYDTFVFIALTILPAISTNIACSYITTKVGYKPLILFRLVMELYLYLLPIVPNPNPYILSIIRLLVPAIFCYHVYLFFQKEHDDEVERKERKHKLIHLIIPCLFVIFVVYMVSGYFHYYAVAIASGSMSPMINRGDVVVIEKIDKNFKSLKEGQVIAYNYEGTLIVHRLVQKIKDKDKYYFYTKGDANKDRDNWTVTENMIIGIVNIKVPYIGMPTVMLSEL